MKKKEMNATKLIDDLIAKLPDWRGKTFAELRKIIRDADPKIIEEWKWMGTPVWSHDGIICIANAHKDKVKVTFHNGASLPDPDRFFNNGLAGNKWRSIDLYQGDKINGKSWLLYSETVYDLQYNGYVESLDSDFKINSGLSDELFRVPDQAQTAVPPVPRELQPRRNARTR